MRLWHKDLIDVLPRQQLLGQWRECCLIAKNIAEQGTPNHLLVNRIMEYPPEHFFSYAMWIKSEMEHRGYKCDFEKFEKWYKQIEFAQHFWLKKENIFTVWHDDKYLKQCFFNLQEKHDCGGIPDEEWVKFESKVFWREVGQRVSEEMIKKENLKGRVNEMPASFAKWIDETEMKLKRYMEGAGDNDRAEKQN